MTDFKITPEDVGRVAVDRDGYHWRIVDFDASWELPVTARNDDECELFDTEGDSLSILLIRWKGETS